MKFPAQTTRCTRLTPRETNLRVTAFFLQCRYLLFPSVCVTTTTVKLLWSIKVRSCFSLNWWNTAALLASDLKYTDLMHLMHFESCTNINCTLNQSRYNLPQNKRASFLQQFSICPKQLHDIVHEFVKVRIELPVRGRCLIWWAADRGTSFRHALCWTIPWRSSWGGRNFRKCLQIKKNNLQEKNLIVFLHYISVELKGEHGKGHSGFKVIHIFLKLFVFYLFFPFILYYRPFIIYTPPPLPTHILQIWRYHSQDLRIRLQEKMEKGKT